MENRLVKRALISVYDKTGLVDFAKHLLKYKIQILSTGGTAKVLRKADIPITDISSYTGFKSIMGGRVKTLHTKIYGGILGKKDDPQHQREMESRQILPIDLVVVNLNPFVKLATGGADFETCIEGIDVGGPSLIRAGAKNFDYVTVATDVGEYESVLKDLKQHNGQTTGALRKFLAREAFGRTAAYDASINQWFSQAYEDDFPKRMTATFRRKSHLLYGENPHQKAAIYYHPYSERLGAPRAQLRQGKPLSFNSMRDANVAFELVGEFQEPTVALIKQETPCAVATGDGFERDWKSVLSYDSDVACGGVVGVNKPVDASMAQKLNELAIELVIAPTYTVEALAILGEKEHLRVLETGGMPDQDEDVYDVRSVAGGLLVQTADKITLVEDDLNFVTKKQATKEEIDDMLFAWRVAKYTKTNAIVLVKDKVVIGISGGQTNRTQAVVQALQKAKVSLNDVSGCVLASDGFFADVEILEQVVSAGVKAVIQPGGSEHDDAITDIADRENMAMVFTKKRHFRH